jgi:PIN domain nuclease of toxin-antitoxin system
VPSVVLDASALLALLLGEPGADVVRPTLADAAMSTVNLAEVVGH